MTEHDVRAAVALEVVRAGSLRALARAWAVNPSYLSDVLRGKRTPGPKVLAPLGLVQVVEVRYEPGKPAGRQRKGVG